MDDEEFWSLVAEYLAAQETRGNAPIGADDPYDDYNLQDTIGGLGAVDGNTYPYEDWADTGLGEPGSGTVAYGSSQVGGRGPWRDVPMYPLPEGPPGRVDRPTVEEILSRLPEQKARRSAGHYPPQNAPTARGPVFDFPERDRSVRTVQPAARLKNDHDPNTLGMGMGQVQKGSIVRRVVQQLAPQQAARPASNPAPVYRAPVAATRFAPAVARTAAPAPRNTVITRNVASRFKP
jgi:hypothetical protein